MSFVPVIVSSPPPPSRRARELGERIRSTIEEYQRYEPGATPTDVRQALDLARPAASSQRALALIAALLMGLFLLGTLLFLGSDSLSEIPWNLVAIGGVAVLAMLFAIIAAVKRGAG